VDDDKVEEVDSFADADTQDDIEDDIEAQADDENDTRVDADTALEDERDGLKVLVYENRGDNETRGVLDELIDGVN